MSCIALLCINIVLQSIDRASVQMFRYLTGEAGRSRRRGGPHGQEEAAPRAAQARASTGICARVVSAGFRDELFSLTPAHFLCYAYGMGLTSGCSTLAGLAPKIGRRPPPANINFDGTKLALEESRPKTTTYGMNCSALLSAIGFPSDMGRGQRLGYWPHSIDLRRQNQHR